MTLEESIERFCYHLPDYVTPPVSHASDVRALVEVALCVYLNDVSIDSDIFASKLSECHPDWNAEDILELSNGYYKQVADMVITISHLDSLKVLKR